VLLVGNYLAGQLIWPASNVLDDRTRIIIQESSLLKGRLELLFQNKIRRHIHKKQNVIVTDLYLK